MYWIIAILIFILKCTSIRTEDDLLVVETVNGKIRGQLNITVEKGLEYYMFEGIPYAKPPLDELRFLAPVEPDNWEGVLNLGSANKICSQLTFGIGGQNIKTVIEEDCLYLNVYTTSLNKTNLPVMVWIYGGGFLIGNAQYQKYAPDFFLENDVVFVSFNYRLGIFGFYSTEDEVAPGNAGIKDQLLALKWVQKNIAKFGGDPKNVTVFGESAGAASVSYLVQMPTAKNLFHKAIMQSGCSLNSWALSRNKRDDMFITGSDLGIITNDSETLLREMQKVPSDELLHSSMMNDFKTLVFANPLSGLLFSPSIEPDVEGAAITGKSYARLERGDFNRVPLIMGYNSLEAVLADNYIWPLKMYMWKNYQGNEQKYVPIGMNVVNSTIQKEVGQNISSHYGLDSIFAADDESLLNFLTQDQFTRGISKAVQLQSKFTPVYFYNFSFVGDGYTGSIKGVGHAVDVDYIFANLKFDAESDELVRERFIRMWTNFAKTGNPTPVPDDNLLGNVTWPKFDNVHKLRLNIQENLVVEDASATLDGVVMEYYDDLFERYGNPPFDTY